MAMVQRYYRCRMVTSESGLRSPEIAAILEGKLTDEGAGWSLCSFHSRADLASGNAGEDECVVAVYCSEELHAYIESQKMTLLAVTRDEVVSKLQLEKPNLVDKFVDQQLSKWNVVE